MEPVITDNPMLCLQASPEDKAISEASLLEVKTTKKPTTKKETKKSNIKKRVKTEKPNYLNGWELSSYLKNIDKIINIWNNVSMSQNIPLEIKNFIYKQLKDSINGKCIDPIEPTLYEYVND